MKANDLEQALKKQIQSESIENKQVEDVQFQNDQILKQLKKVEEENDSLKNMCLNLEGIVWKLFDFNFKSWKSNSERKNLILEISNMETLKKSFEDKFQQENLKSESKFRKDSAVFVQEQMKPSPRILSRNSRQEKEILRSIELENQEEW